MERRYTDEELKIAIKTSHSLRMVFSKLGLRPDGGSNYRNVKKAIQKLGLDTSHFKSRRDNRTYTTEDLASAVRKNHSMRGVMKTLGLSLAGGSYKTVKRRILELGLDTSHFTGQAHMAGKTHSRNRTIPLMEILVENSNYKGTNYSLKPRLVKAGILLEKCYNPICDVKTIWCGKPINLHLDHINGNNNDYRSENLRLLCPNCHSQTDTYCGRNKGKWPGGDSNP